MFRNATATTPGGDAVLPPMESFRVLGLETVEPAYAQFQGEMYAGLLPITHESPERTVEGEMMFWLFEPETQEVENTLVIWLNGGPGCSVSKERREDCRWTKSEIHPLQQPFLTPSSLPLLPFR
jgi:Serine carboxypeptidase